MKLGPMVKKTPTWKPMQLKKNRRRMTHEMKPRFVLIMHSNGSRNLTFDTTRL